MANIFGDPVPDWTPPPRPTGQVLDGGAVQLLPLTPDHAADLHRAFRVDDTLWDYLPYGPFDADGLRAWIAQSTVKDDPLFYALRDLRTGHLGGIASFLRIAPEAGSIEVGHLNFAPELQRGRAATEAMALMMAWAFDAGYRRYEWKCNALNLPSRRAAQRLGFSYEGVFRQAAVVKGHNRDTAWFAVTDKDWPVLREAFAEWLAPDNFDAEGRQRLRLSDLTRPVRVASDPAL